MNEQRPNGCPRSGAFLYVKFAEDYFRQMSHKERKIVKTIEYLHVYSASNYPIRIYPQYIKTTWDDAFDRYKSFIVKSESDPNDVTKWTATPLNKAIRDSGIRKSDVDALTDFRMSHADCIFQTAVNKSKDYPKEPKGRFLVVDGVLIYNGREVELASKKIREIDGELVPTTILGDIWTDIGINNVFQEGGSDIELRFGKKPEMLLERVIKTFTSEGDIVLDFFVGTGTTAAVAHKLKRRWLAVEQLDYIDELTVPRLKRVVAGEQSGISQSAKWEGGGSFVLVELAASNSAFTRAIDDAKDISDLQGIFVAIKNSGYLRYNLDLDQFDGEEFASLTFSDAKRILMDCLDVNRLYVNLASLGDSDFEISSDDVEATQSFYGLR